MADQGGDEIAPTANSQDNEQTVEETERADTDGDRSEINVGHPDETEAATTPVNSETAEAGNEESAGEEKIRNDELESEKAEGDGEGGPLSSPVELEGGMEGGEEAEAEPLQKELGVIHEQSEEEDEEEEAAAEKRGDEAKKHKVSITVTIATAIPSVEDDESTDDPRKKKSRVVESPKAQGYYHCAYYLLPTDKEPTKSDVVTYGIAAKIYQEHESKVVKTWQVGDKTWVAWTHTHTITVTKELLLKLIDHTLELRIWDSKEKVSPKARFDRPKVFRFGKRGDDGNDPGAVKPIVLRQAEIYMDLQPKKSFVDRSLPEDVPSEVESVRSIKTADSKASSGKDTADGSQAAKPMSPAKTPFTLLSVPILSTREDSTMRTYSRLGRLAGMQAANESKHLKQVDEQKAKLAKAREKERGGDKDSTKVETPLPKRGHTRQVSRQKKKATASSPIDKEARRLAKKAEAAAAVQAAYIKQHGNCIIQVKMKKLFSGTKHVISRLDKPVQGIEDVFISLEMDGPLLSREQKRELNPLVIKVANAINMPGVPLSYAQLQAQCHPVYTTYKFFDLESRSPGRPHDSSIHWEDINVILLGTLDPARLREYLLGPMLQVELHDRDRRVQEPVKPDSVLFGEDMEDDKINNVSMVTGKRTIHNPFEEKSKTWDPYGVARFNLSDLLLGERVLNLSVPVHSCPIPDLLGARTGAGKLMGITNSVDGPKEMPLPTGNYLESNTQLKVKFELAEPLVTVAELKEKAPVQTSETCPFGCIVYIFDYKNTKFLHQLQSLVTRINAAALSLDTLPPQVITAALSTYKLSDEQQVSQMLDIVTGFQIMDGEVHVFVLEGLRDGAITTFWETLPRLQNQAGVVFEVLYNSAMTFSSRKYVDLDVDLCRIKLHEPLSVIVQQPLLYIRDMVPRPCFEAIDKLEKLLTTEKLRDATRNDLFPTSEMILSLSKEFGVPLTAADFEELREPDSEAPKRLTIDRSPTEPQLKTRRWSPIDMENIRYREYLEQKRMQGVTHNYVRENIKMVREKSRSLERPKKPKAVAMPYGGVAYNYSSQALNSTEYTKERLRQEFDKYPAYRFTYSQQYNSATVPPVNLEEARKREAEDSIKAWKSTNGLIYPGPKTHLESNAHPKKPDPARIDDLLDEWHENTLHANTMKPTLEREVKTWSERDADFDLWQRPRPNFGGRQPTSIHLAGDTLAQEVREAREREAEAWESQLVVGASPVRMHRCATDTELLAKGLKASNQLDRLKGLLKDPPKKLALKKPERAMKEIPPLSVVMNPSVDTAARELGYPILPGVNQGQEERHHGFTAGPYEEHRWVLEKNKIPIRSMEHQRFAAAKGHDFNVYHREKSPLHRLHIQPLEEEERRENNLFRFSVERPQAGQKVRPGNQCFLQPPPGIRPAPIRTEYYYPNREEFWDTPCPRGQRPKKITMLQSV